MGIFRLALRSLRTDLFRSIIYFVVFVLTTIFIFFFFNFTFAPNTGINMGKDDTSFVTFIATLVISVAMLCVFLTNDFYVSNKSKDISVILMAGASVYQVGFYLFIQCSILMILAIPLGFMIGYALMPLTQIVFQEAFLMSGQQFYVSNQSLLATTIILLFEVLWSTLLNVGYCYRSSVQTLMKTSVEIEGVKFIKIKDIYWIILYCLPIVIFLFTDDILNYFFPSCIGMLGVYGLLRKVIPNYIHARQQDTSLKNSKQLIALGFLKDNIQKVFLLVLIVMISSILLMTLVIYYLEDPLIGMIALISYGSVMVLMAITIASKIAMELQKRKKSYLHLQYLGFQVQQLKEIIHLEMFLFYGLILVIPLIYQLEIVIKLVYTNQITWTLVSILLVLQILPMLISGLLCTILYRKILPQIERK